MSPIPYSLFPLPYCLLPTAYCLLPTAYCLLPIAYCLLPTAYCLLPIAYCLLPTAYSLLPIRPMDPLVIPLPDSAATARLGGALAPLLRIGDVVGLSGSLGAGKTTLARGLIAAASGEREAPSPTFGLVEIYEGGTAAIWHFDLYRIDRLEEIFELGLEEAFAEGISLIEWPERIAHLIPEPALFIRLDLEGAARTARLLGTGDWPARLAAGKIAPALALAAESPERGR